jgi:hypothetical protein
MTTEQSDALVGKLARVVCFGAGCIGPCEKAGKCVSHIDGLKEDEHTMASVERLLPIIAAREAAVWKAAAAVATSFLVGDPKNDVPLRSPMPHEIAAAINTKAQETTNAE